MSMLFIMSVRTFMVPLFHIHMKKIWCLLLCSLFFVQNIHYYIINCTTKFVTNSNPMAFLLSRWIINQKYIHWIIILQEFDIEFVTPKSKKG